MSYKPPNQHQPTGKIDEVHFAFEDFARQLVLACEKHRKHAMTASE